MRVESVPLYCKSSAGTLETRYTLAHAVNIRLPSSVSHKLPHVLTELELLLIILATPWLIDHFENQFPPTYM